MALISDAILKQLMRSGMPVIIIPESALLETEDDINEFDLTEEGNFIKAGIKRLRPKRERNFFSKGFIPAGVPG